MPSANMVYLLYPILNHPVQTASHSLLHLSLTPCETEDLEYSIDSCCESLGMVSTFSGFHILVFSSSPKKAVVGHCQSVKIRLGPTLQM